MSDNLKDILSNLNKDIEQSKLLDYLNKNLSDAETHEVEKQMADDPFMNDAMEGLTEFKDTKNLSFHVKELNHGLKQQLAKKNKRKARKLKDQPWVYFTIVLLLLLIVISYVLIKKRMEKRRQQQATPTIIICYNNDIKKNTAVF